MFADPSIPFILKGNTILLIDPRDIETDEDVKAEPLAVALKIQTY